MAPISYADMLNRGSQLVDDPMLMEIGPGKTNSDPHIHAEQLEAEFSQTLKDQISHLELHPTKAKAGEELPQGYYRNYAGFLIRNTKRVIYLDDEIVAANAACLSTHMAIATFVGGRPSPSAMPQWLRALNARLSPGYVARGTRRPRLLLYHHRLPGVTKETSYAHDIQDSLELLHLPNLEARFPPRQTPRPQNPNLDLPAKIPTNPGRTRRSSGKQNRDTHWSGREQQQHNRPQILRGTRCREGMGTNNLLRKQNYQRNHHHHHRLRLVTNPV